MASEVVNKYIAKRYDRWLDYSKYFSTQAGISDEAVDILNEVLCMLLQKNQEYVQNLYEAKNEKYTELDFYVLKMIRLNITSPTSPYQHKYKPIPADDNINWQRLDVVDETEETPDKVFETLNKYHQVREIFESLNLSKKARRIFSWKFFEDESFSDWIGPEDKRELYSIYNQVIEIIRNKIRGGVLDL